MTDYTELFNVVLIEPEIPPNTGNVARLCAATGACLHLVGKLGFSIDDRQLKRAGLDYWDKVEVRQWGSLEELQAAFPDGRFWYLSTKVARNCYDSGPAFPVRPQYRCRFDRWQCRAR